MARYDPVDLPQRFAMSLRMVLVSLSVGLTAWIGVTLARRRTRDLDVGTVSPDWVSRQRGRSDTTW